MSETKEQIAALLEPLAGRLPEDTVLEVTAADGHTLASFGDGGGPQGAQPGRTRIARRIGVGAMDEVVVHTADPVGDGAVWVEALLEETVQRIRLETDMESMNYASLSMLEQAAVYADVLPELAGQFDEDATIVKTLAEMVRAVGLKSCVFLRHTDGILEPMLRVVAGAGEATQAMPEGIAPLRVDEGQDASLADLLADGSTLAGFTEAYECKIPAAWRQLAEQEAVFAPVRYGDSQTPSVLGLIMACDTAASSFRQDGRTLGSEESKTVENFACILGAVLGARQSARLAGELSTAHEIQQLILPSHPPRVPGYDVAGDCKPSGAVGGDYYDFFELQDGRTLVVVADVSGHNLASGMVMVEARATLRALARDASDPVELFDKFAAALYPDLSATERFLTAVGLALEPGTGRVEIVNAGHNDTLVVRRADGRVEKFASEDTVIGFMARAHHERGEVRLEPGDVMMVYTDGITEAVGPDEEMFGEERLDGVLKQVAAQGSAREILDAVLEAVGEFQTIDADRFDDDVTAVVLAYRGRHD